ncbi:MAG: magnesium transporter CorA family protein [Candidatus Buchananbacteria bacterium]|nr:magnesium transporter CorA family protein [Candidatus Buchananbacteria bacterium]
MPNNITTLKSSKGNLSWINVINAKEKEIDYLRRKYKFKELDLADSYAQKYAQRPKLHIRNNYFFLILQFPYYDKKKMEIVAEEIDFFVTKNEVITVHKNNLEPIVGFFNECRKNAFVTSQYLGGDNSALLYEMIIRLQYYIYPILDHISIDIQNIEDNMFAGQERQMVNEILYIKRNILNMRKIMEAHKNVIQKIIKENIKFFPMQKQLLYYDSIIEHSKDIWSIMSGQKDTIEALENTNTSLVSFKLNDIMRLLTIFSVIVIPLTLLASIFGMNVTFGMPFIDNPYGFWSVIGIMIIVTLVMFIFFKRKKLL